MKKSFVLDVNVGHSKTFEIIKHYKTFRDMMLFQNPNSTFSRILKIEDNISNLKFLFPLQNSYEFEKHNDELQEIYIFICIQ